eukprot:scaffold59870_cov69-Phaeocystis_antarctica.AAC.1
MPSRPPGGRGGSAHPLRLASRRASASAASARASGGEGARGSASAHPLRLASPGRAVAGFGAPAGVNEPARARGSMTPPGLPARRVADRVASSDVSEDSTLPLGLDWRAWCCICARACA